MTAVGDRIGDRLRLDREIGRGAMGVVFQATDTALDRKVAVKIMTAELASDRDLVERFVREAKMAAKLETDHVPRVLEVGTDAASGPYMVMEYLEGESLETILAREGPLPWARVVTLVLEALDGIGAAHRAGLVHRDLKPANLFIARRRDREASVKVLDFGVAKDVLSQTKTRLTQTGDSIGTPVYMAPEQVRANVAVDARTDIWGIGITIFELVTGALPFDASSVPALLDRILNHEPIALRTLRPDAPDALERIVSRCLAKAPDDRFPSTTELARALEALVVPAPKPRKRSAPERPRRSAAPIFVASALVIVIGGSAVAFVVMRDRAPPPTVSVDAGDAAPVVSELPIPTSEPIAEAVIVDASSPPDARAPAPPPPQKRRATGAVMFAIAGKCVDPSPFEDARGPLSACAVAGRCFAGTQVELRFDANGTLYPPSIGWDRDGHMLYCEETSKLMHCINAIKTAHPPRSEGDHVCSIWLKMQ